MYCNTYFGCVDSSLSQGQPNLKLFVKVKVKQITEQLFIRVERFRLMQYAIHAKWKSDQQRKWNYQRKQPLHPSTNLVQRIGVERKIDRTASGVFGSLQGPIKIKHFCFD